MILSGDLLAAFKTYYSEEVIGTSNKNEKSTLYTPVDYAKNLSQFSDASVRNIMVSEEEGVAAVEWDFDYPHKEWGERRFTQVAVQRWVDSKIVSEKFMYTG